MKIVEEGLEALENKEGGYMDKLLTVTDVQKILKIGKNQAYKLVNKKGFPKILIGKKILIPEAEFERYIMSHIRSKIDI